MPQSSDCYNPPPGTPITETLQLQCATSPKTVLSTNILRKGRISNPTVGSIVLRSSVCQSYPGWANIGLQVEVKPYKFPLAVVIDRSNPAAKNILIVDPTNAHFYEKKDIPIQSRIWMDVVDEVKANIRYTFKCRCPSKGACTCCDDWGVIFFRTKEQMDNNLPYVEKIQKLALTGILNTMICAFFDEYVKLGGKSCGKFFQSEEEQNNVRYWMPGELVDVKRSALQRLQQLGMDENNLINGKPPVILPEGINLSKLSLKTACTNCGRDETVDGELKRCSRCKKECYCGAACQKEDWGRHKPECIPPPINIGKDAVLFPMMTIDPETHELVFMQAKDTPKLQTKKQKNKK